MPSAFIKVIHCNTNFCSTCIMMLFKFSGGQALCRNKDFPELQQIHAQCTPNRANLSEIQNGTSTLISLGEGPDFIKSIRKMTVVSVDQGLAWFKISSKVHEHFAFSAKQYKSMYLACEEALISWRAAVGPIWQGSDVPWRGEGKQKSSRLFLEESEHHLPLRETYLQVACMNNMDDGYQVS